MNRNIFIIAIIIAVLLGGSYLVIKYNPQLQSEPLIKSIAKVFHLIEEPVIPKSYNAVL